jgi:hypothetical protein
LVVCEQELALDGDVVGASGFTGATAGAADFGVQSGDFGVFEHGLFLTALGSEIVVIPHNGVDGDTVRALGFAFAAGMAAVELPARFSIGIQFGLVWRC